jgi:endonuclease/exonuclease/phosphatase family metal-dependent hydrolase
VITLTAAILIALTFVILDSSYIFAQTPAPELIAIDAQFNDWGKSDFGAVDEQYIYAHFLTKREVALQSDGLGYVLRLDLDGVTGTGVSAIWKGDTSMGTDLEVVFGSTAAGRTGTAGMKVVVLGQPQLSLFPGDVDLFFAPCHAASEFELRLSRDLAERYSGVSFASTARGAFVSLQPDGSEQLLASFGFTQHGNLNDRVSTSIPQPNQKGIRVVSYNMFNNAVLKKTPAFGRMLTALQPDVLLIQEWPENVDLAAWLSKHVSPTRTWKASPVADGVSVASWMPLKTNIERPSQRASLATVTTSLGDILFCSLHMKCCGGSEGPEERQRVRDSISLNAVIRRANGSVAAVIVGGDFNLVGGPSPLDFVSDGIDSGRPLATVATHTLNDASSYTWRDHAQPFSPGRLDWVLFTSSHLTPVQGFSLDAGRLSDSARTAAGLHTNDGLASDHLPVVADFVLAE